MERAGVVLQGLAGREGSHPLGVAHRAAEARYALHHTKRLTVLWQWLVWMMWCPESAGKHLLKLGFVTLLLALLLDHLQIAGGEASHPLGVADRAAEAPHALQCSSVEESHLAVSNQSLLRRSAPPCWRPLLNVCLCDHEALHHKHGRQAHQLAAEPANSTLTCPCHTSSQGLAVVRLCLQHCCVPTQQHLADNFRLST